MLGQIDELVAYHQSQRGNSPMLETVRDIVRKAVDEADVWQRMAACITDYSYTREQVDEQKTTVR